LDRRFIQAFTEPARVRILGRLVYPFCLKHRLQLLALDSPFLRDGDPAITAADLILAVKVCAEESLEPTWRDTWEGVKLARSRKYMTEEGQKFLLYAGSANWPKFWEAKQSGGNATGMPWIMAVVCNLVKHGVPEDRAWNMPEAQAIWMSTGFMANEPGTGIKVLTTEEEEMLDQVARVEASHGPQT
jgi:hypothetical protein